MTLQLNTLHGLLTLGAAPPTRLACAFCGAPAQLATEQDGLPLVAACASCVESDLRERARGTA